MLLKLKTVVFGVRQLSRIKINLLWGPRYIRYLHKTKERGKRKRFLAYFYKFANYWDCLSKQSNCFQTAFRQLGNN